MSNTPEFELDLDLQLLPSWARQPSTENRYAKYEGDTEGDRRGRRGDRAGGDREPWRNRPARRGPGGGGGDRPPRSGGPRDGRGDRPRGPRPEGRPGGPRPERQEPEIPLPDLDVNLTPDEAGVEGLARQIKLTGRAYPLFGIAELILKRPDKVHVQLQAKKGADGKVAQPIVVCSLDESLWLNEGEAVQHILRHHFATFYQVEKVPTDPPKGTYTFVAQCGMSGTIFGPPNYHDYQSKLRQYHAEHFARMPFEAYKSRVRIVKDEAVVKQWIEEQSARLEYVCLNMPEPLRLNSRSEVEQHFRTTHLPNLIQNVETHTIRAGAKRPATSPGLQRLIRHAIEDQKRFPLKIATVLSQQFARHGLQFFKVNRTVTHVCVARPHYLDLTATVVSDGIKRIVEFINATPHCTRRKLIAALAPTPPKPKTPTAPAPTAEAPAADGTQPATAAPAPAPVAAAEPQPTPEQTAVITDLHWLIHQGHVIEFTDGRIETAKAPKPKPAAPAAAGSNAPAEPEAKAADVVIEPAPATEAAAPAPAEAPAPAAVGEVPTPAPATEATAAPEPPPAPPTA